ncbi:MAG: hypothetical protein Q9227_001610 [Pyrenula ochraceoflavens]
MVVQNASFASPLANANYHPPAAYNSLLSYLFRGVNGWTAVLAAFLLCVAYDQISYVFQKGSIAGPSMKLPFMGPFLESVNPKFEKYMAKWASGDLSCVSVFHKFVVIASTRDMARKVFNSPTFVKPCVVDVAHKLLRPANWVFLDGKAHVEYRKGLNGLFTRQALESYLPGQEEVYDKYFGNFVKISSDAQSKPVPWMPVFRELMCAVSCRTFVGHYMSEKAVKKVADDYYLITAALELVNFPIIIPFTKTWYGKKAADMVMDEFTKCAAKSKVRMAAGGSVTCIMDAWIQAMQESAKYREKVAQGISVDDSEKPPMLLRDFSDIEIAMTIFTFLFASQDATSSACTWLFQIMADRPDLLDKVREENLRLRGGNRDVPFSMDLLEKMTYTRAIVKETLRYRPPVIMVPYLAKKDFPITDGYTVKKGSMVVPTVWPSTHDPEAYPNPDSFEPERWITGDAEKSSKNWLVFGTGPHYCLGQTYAQLNLIAMIGKASMCLDWEHHATPKSEDIKVFATIFPQVIGGGAVGLAIARQLASHEGTSTILIERHGSVGTETSSRNSEVIHAGLYYGPHSLKTKLCISGKQKLYSLCAAQAIPHKQTKKWILAQTPQQMSELTRMHAFAQSLGGGGGDVPTRFLSRREIEQREPDVRAREGVLESESTGILDSHAYIQYLEGDFVERGGECAFNTSVSRIEPVRGGEGGYEIYTTTTSSSPNSSEEEEEENEPISASTLINSSGLAAVSLSNSLLPPPRHLTPHFAKGTYYSYSSSHPKPSTLLYPAPVPGHGGLGTHLTMDLAGQIRFGPDVEYVASPHDLSPNPARLKEAVDAIREYLPGVREEAVGLDYCGIRPKVGRSSSLASPSSEGKGGGGGFQDFIIREEEGLKGFVNLLAIESPGLTASLGIGEMVDGLLYGGKEWKRIGEGSSAGLEGFQRRTAP